MNFPKIEGLTTRTDRLKNDVDVFNNLYSEYENSCKDLNNKECIQKYIKLLDAYNTVLIDTALTPEDKKEIDDLFNNIVNTYNIDIVKKRTELDAKLKEINKTGDSVYNKNDKPLYDATIFSGILWTILASSVLFYTFTKL
jgi:vacuolar-type H+-ATPase catalytic subunit A/Vma1